MNETLVSYPLLKLILILWTLFAIYGIFLTIYTKMKKTESFQHLMDKLRDFFHQRHSHQK